MEGPKTKEVLGRKGKASPCSPTSLRASLEDQGLASLQEPFCGAGLGGRAVGPAVPKVGLSCLHNPDLQWMSPQEGMTECGCVWWPVVLRGQSWR